MKACRGTPRFLKTSLRAQIAVGVALPVLLVLVSLSLIHYWRAHQLLDEQIRLTVSQLGEVLIGSLRFSMLNNSPELLARTLNDIGERPSVRQIQIIGLDNQVKVSSQSSGVGRIWRTDEAGCVECHRYPADARPHSTWFPAADGVLRVSVPITNEPDCVPCHAQQDTHLGVLLADVSVVDVERHLRDGLRTDLIISLGVTLLVTLGVYLAVQRLIVRRVEALGQPLARFAAGDLSARAPESPEPTDELGHLANLLNRMADDLQRRERKQEEIQRLRQQAIAQERRRIARDLHDGLAQLLGYVNSKAMAARLMLRKGNLDAADRNLRQLEDAARDLFGDVRAAIVDLKTERPEGADLSLLLQDVVARSVGRGGLSICLDLSPTVEGLSLPMEVENHLLRIVQESLNNVRKHAPEASASVRMDRRDHLLELVISDDGPGFDPNQVPDDGQFHFGLISMRERAAEIGADLILDSQPGEGTRITVRLPLEE